MRTHTCGKEKKGGTGVDNTSRVTQERSILTISDSLVDSPVLMMKDGPLLQNIASNFTHVCRWSGGCNGYIVNFTGEPVGTMSASELLDHRRNRSYFDSSTPPKAISPFLTPSVDEGS